MRIKTVALALAVAVTALTVSAVPALADTLTLTGVGGANSDGVYVYPYIFTVVQGGKTTTNVSLSCLNFDREISFGETWAVKEYAIPTGTGTLDGETYANYRADAWLYTQYSNSAYTATEVQFAIWDIMDPTGVAGKQGFDTKPQNLAATAKTMATTLPSSFFANEVLYIPDTSNSSGWGSNGEPQIFIGSIAPTPEPSSLLLFGTGLFATVGVLQRRNLVAARAVPPTR